MKGLYHPAQLLRPREGTQLSASLYPDIRGMFTIIGSIVKCSIRGLQLDAGRIVAVEVGKNLLVKRGRKDKTSSKGCAAEGEMAV